VGVGRGDGEGGGEGEGDGDGDGDGKKSDPNTTYVTPDCVASPKAYNAPLMISTLLSPFISPTLMDHPKKSPLCTPLIRIPSVPRVSRWKTSGGLGELKTAYVTPD
jgi:hypothetical protein